MKSCAFLAKDVASTGNATTVSRIAQSLGHSFHVTCYSSQDIKSLQTLHDRINANEIDVLLGLHAYHAAPGARLLPSHIPFILVLGGTDMNDCPKPVEMCTTIRETLERANVIVAFCQHMELKAKKILEESGISPLPRFERIPQGIIIPKIQPRSTPSFRQTLGLSDTHDAVFLLLASIRPVKDPLYLVDAFRAWYDTKQPRAHLVICGAALDLELTKQLEMYANLQTTSSDYHGVRYLGCLSTDAALSALTEATALLNTSVAEGMSGALLEAMALRIPIVARNNPGNASIVTHRQTGLLFNTPDEAIALMSELCDATLSTSSSEESKTLSMVQTLRETAHAYVTQVHHVDMEAKKYVRVVNSVFDDEKNK